MKKDKKVVGLFFSGIILLVLIISISSYKSWFLPETNTELDENTSTDEIENLESIITSEKVNESEEIVAEHIFILPEGNTVAARINTPKGYERIKCNASSFAEFARNYSVKPDGSPVLLYNGNDKRNQSAHVAVLELPIEAEDLQQCADSVMRIYAEYYYNTGQYDKIKFHFVSGFLAEYEKWQEGYRISIEGKQVSWVKKQGFDDSYETFKKYMRIVFAYASTLSMERESDPISIENIQIGDVFLKGGSPGHVVMIIDICQNEQGEKAFLLAQGYMPAQEFHILKNPNHEDDPWYYVNEIEYPLHTPEYTFSEGSLRRLEY